MHICFQMPIASIHYKQACHHLGSDCCMRLCAGQEHVLLPTGKRSGAPLLSSTSNTCQRPGAHSGAQQ